MIVASYVSPPSARIRSRVSMLNFTVVDAIYREYTGLRPCSRHQRAQRPAQFSWSAAFVMDLLAC
jgi:hypothetical protein